MTQTLLIVDTASVVPGDNIRADLGDLKEMVASVKAQGILEPLIVRETAPGSKGKYEVIAGHRRLASAIKAGLDQVPVVVGVFTDAQRDEAMLVENLMRKDLAPSEEAKGYFRCVERGMTPAALSKRIGRPVAHITERLSLLELDDKTLTAIDSGALTLTNALHVLRAQEAGVAAAKVKELAKLGGRGGSISYDVDRAIKEKKMDEQVARAVAIAEKGGAKTIVLRSYGDKRPTTPEAMQIDPAVHRQEPCDVVVIDAYNSQGGKPKVYRACSDTGRHTKKGASPVKAPVPARGKSDAEKAADAKRKAADEKRLMQDREVVAKAKTSDLNQWMLCVVLADIDAEVQKHAVRLLDLEVVMRNHPWDKKKDGTPRQTPDYYATLMDAASGSDAKARRVATAVVVARSRHDYRISGAWGAVLGEQVNAVRQSLSGEAKPKVTKPATVEPATEPLRLDPEPVTPDVEPLAPDAEPQPLDPAPVEFSNASQ